MTAKPFFLAMGFSVIQEQEVFCRGETFINYKMEKLLSEGLILRPLKQSEALAILNWRYAPPYDYYNSVAASFERDLSSLLDPENAYHAILNSQEELEGFCCFGADAQVPGGDYEAEALDIGMGIRPDLTGQGQGTYYAQAVVRYGIKQYAAPKLRVTIAHFNDRAQRLWQKLGFAPAAELTEKHGTGRFVIMTRPGPLSK